MKSSECSRLQRTALFLVGAAQPLGFDSHMALVHERYVKLHAADVFASTDYRDEIASRSRRLPAWRALPAIFGPSLKALAVLEEGKWITADEKSTGLLRRQRRR